MPSKKPKPFRKKRLTKQSTLRKMDAALLNPKIGGKIATRAEALLAIANHDYQAGISRLHPALVRALEDYIPFLSAARRYLARIGNHKAADAYRKRLRIAQEIRELEKIKLERHKLN